MTAGLIGHGTGLTDHDDWNAHHYGRTQEIHRTWSLFLEEPALDAPPIAKWVTTVSHRTGLDYEINASPVVAGPYLRRALWERAAGVILTSATMTSLGTFEDFLRRSGLTAYPAVRCVDLPSPFDYARQATLEIPRLAASPKDPEGHTREVGQRVIDLIGQCQGGMLVLFTSRRQMDAVAAMLPPDLRPRVQVQGEGSRAALIAEHKARGDRGETAVIFGMDSMAEGVDLAGRYCTQVVVAKLPFAVPDDPILRTLSDWIETRGGEPFAELIVPEAGRKLAQAVGRLIRTEQDQGTVTVLDPRLWNTGYGRRMLRGLPPFRVVAMGRGVTP
jgi:ATP-dependent DNA helicase DinG